MSTTTTGTPPRRAKYPTRFGTTRPKVAPFARYRGTSAWRHNKVRVRAYYRHLAAQLAAAHAKQA